MGLGLDWQKDAACKDIGPELFFASQEAGQGPGRLTSQTEMRILEAKKVCADCPVRAACLEFAIDFKQEFGIWGGTTANQREQMRRERAARIRLHLA